jgi:hypothetical protein
MRTAPEDDTMNPTTNAAPSTAATPTMRQWLTAGNGIGELRMTTVIDSIASVTDIQAALHRLTADGHLGKIVLTTDT